MKTLKITPKALAKRVIFGLLIISASLIQIAAFNASASAAVQCGPQNAGLADCQSGGPNANGQSSTTATTPTSSAACKNTTTSTALNNCLKQSPFVHDIQMIINFLSAGIGIVVIGVIILGGIQYSIAGDNASATAAAKQRIINGLIALVAFIFTFAFLNWLLPGGAFG